MEVALPATLALRWMISVSAGRVDFKDSAHRAGTADVDGSSGGDGFELRGSCKVV
jgi:hypothetical protein